MFFRQPRQASTSLLLVIAVVHLALIASKQTGADLELVTCALAISSSVSPQENSGIEVNYRIDDKSVSYVRNYVRKRNSNVSGERSPFDGSCCSGQGVGDSTESEEIEEVSKYRVVLLGDSGVGKTALVSQFMTSEYINTYDASLALGLAPVSKERDLWKTMPITRLERRWLRIDILALRTLRSSSNSSKVRYSNSD
ncbi:hypothetical protein WN48_02582 [Eufriesea mexicana]|uniref:Uncharacterized protein n=1 Tax=Eufriesea mexicana TaxID=516756 RepID=A0A310SQF2_9HYME|nr:hypothetical protein WN48_02582 [Eufriesea mexicana]